MAIEQTNSISLAKAIKQTIRFSSPLVVFRIINAVGNFVSLLFIARLGHEQLAASALISSTLITLIVCAWSIMFSESVVIGKLFGANKLGEIGKVVQQSWWLASLISIVITLVFWNITPFFKLLHQPESLVNLATGYFRGFAWGILPSMWFVCCQQFVAGIGKPKLVVIWSVLSLPILLIPGYGLVFGTFGLPKLGIIGMGYAYTFMYWFMLICVMLYLYFAKDFLPYKIFKRHLNNKTNYFAQVFHVGWPISVQYSTELWGLAVATFIMGWFGTNALAAQQMIVAVGFIVIMVPMGISQGTGILISHSIGNNRYSDTRVYVNAGLLVGLGFTLLVALVYWFCPLQLIRLYLDIHNPANQATIEIAITLFAIVGISQIFDSTKNICIGALRGFHDTQIPMMVGSGSVWLIGIPLGYLLAFSFHIGPPGIRLGLFTSFFTASIILLHRLFQKTKETDLIAVGAV